MGGGTPDIDALQAQATLRRMRGQADFGHTDDIRSGRRRAEAHEYMDPRRRATRGPNEGRVVREVCISAEHPDPTAIAVLFDVTGSMGGLAKVVQQALPRLYGRLVDQRYADDPQLLFGAIGDARTDDVPLQMGQFESDNRSDEQLRALYLEGHGGGQGSETYELGAYYLARAAHMEPLIQRGKKGYLFTVGDERPTGWVCQRYGGRQAHTFESLTGMALEADVPLDEVVRQTTEKFEWFHFVVDSTKFGGMYRVGHSLPAWQDALGERASALGEPEALPDAIALVVGVMEGKVDMGQGLYDLRETGTDLVVAEAVGRAVEPAYA